MIWVDLRGIGSRKRRAIYGFRAPAAALFIRHHDPLEFIGQGTSEKFPRRRGARFGRRGSCLSAERNFSFDLGRAAGSQPKC